MASPKTIRWGILATGGIAKTLCVPRCCPARALTDTMQYQGSTRRPNYARSHAFKAYRCCCCIIIIGLPRSRLSERHRLARRCKGLWLLPGAGQRPQRRYCVRRHTTLAPLSERNARSRGRQVCAVRESLHREC